MRASFGTVKKIEAAARRCSLKNVALKTFTKFKRKHLCQSFFLIKLQAKGLQLYQMQAPAQVFSCEFSKIFNNAYFEEHLRTTASKKRTTKFLFILSLNCFMCDLESDTEKSLLLNLSLKCLKNCLPEIICFWRQLFICDFVIHCNVLKRSFFI